MQLTGESTFDWPMSAPSLTLEGSDSGAVLHLAGRFLTRSLGTVEKRFADLSGGTGPLRIDMSEVDVVDTGGAWLICDLMARLQAEGVAVVFLKTGSRRRARG